MSWRAEFLAPLLVLLSGVAAAESLSDLLDAVRDGRREEVGRLLATGLPVDGANRFGVTPLQVACESGDAALVRQLLAADADPNRAGSGGERPLMIAARVGRPEPVVALLEAGAAAGAADKHGQTALHWAATGGHAAVVRLLLEAGVDRDPRLPSGLTPWLLAARGGHEEVVEVLLAAGADVNAALGKGGGGRRPRKGMSALLFAVENGHFELAARLLEAGADPNDARSGFTPLHALSWVRKPRRGDGIDGTPPPRGTGKIGSLDLVDELVRRGADVNLALGPGPGNADGLGREGATPFLFAARTADLPLMRKLVAHGADPRMANDSGRTPLLAASGVMLGPESDEAASEDEALAAAEYLVGLGADLDAVDSHGDSVMHGAAYKQSPKLVRFFAARGADPAVWFRENKQGRTPLRIARGFRPGNFKPSAPTEEALVEVLRGAGIAIPPTPPRPGRDQREDYGD